MFISVQNVNFGMSGTNPSIRGLWAANLMRDEVFTISYHALKAGENRRSSVLTRFFILCKIKSIWKRPITLLR